MKPDAYPGGGSSELVKVSGRQGAYTNQQWSLESLGHLSSYYKATAIRREAPARLHMMGVIYAVSVKYSV